MDCLSFPEKARSAVSLYQYLEDIRSSSASSAVPSPAVPFDPTLAAVSSFHS